MEERCENMKNQFLTNYTEESFLNKIKNSLRTCTSFYFSVSFIKKAGLVLIYRDIEAAVIRGCKGRIITSTYQNFTDIESLRSFYTLQDKASNFECHLDYNSFHDDHYSPLGYHTKGYLFEYEDSCELIVGSSNITRYALLKNIEWDVVIKEKMPSDVYMQAINEFGDKWENTYSLNIDIINQYANKLYFAIERWDMDYDLSSAKIKPNFMQRKALKELNRYRAMGVGRALIVASAGSGKTFLAAFDACNFNPKRLLYIVHEGSILKKSMETFQEVFGNSVTYGIYNGENKDLDADFVFASNVIMSRSLELFDKNTFDYVVIDECHHATASSYQKIMSYFEPGFYIGLTATPERMDNQDVFGMFDMNIPYELRLRDAIINDLIVPFKYYGIRDVLVDYGLAKNDERRMIAQLANIDHCDFICSEIEKHRPADKLKALAFCRNVTHARMMCEALGERYHSAYLTGKNDIGERIRAYNDLQNDKAELEILFTVDILNEGVDIPGVNMVLFLRPTDSSTVFIQQLGRGLRKYENKSYVTVLDFIGNSYKRSVQIAFALGSLAENFVMEKRLMMALVKDNFYALSLEQYGVEIHIDDLSKEEIVEYIDSENFNSLTYLKQDYFNFKKYINAEYYPKHMDFLNNDCAPDLLRFLNTKISGKKNGSYYNFLYGIEEQHLPVFSEAQAHFVYYISDMLPLVRPYEYMIFDLLLQEITTVEGISEHLQQATVGFKYEEFQHALEYILKQPYVNQDGNHLILKVQVDEQLEDYARDLIAYGLKRYKSEYNDHDEFILWHNYRIDQVQLKLCKNPGYTMKGTYVYDSIVYIFAGLKKDASVEEHLNYRDKFIDADIFQWECEAGLNNEKQNELIYSKKAVLFIRKVSSEHGIQLPFIYVGTGKLTNPRKTDNIKGSLLFDIKMEQVLPDYLQFDFGLTK